MCSTSRCCALSSGANVLPGSDGVSSPVCCGEFLVHCRSRSHSGAPQRNRIQTRGDATALHDSRHLGDVRLNATRVRAKRSFLKSTESFNDVPPLGGKVIILRSMVPAVAKN